MLALSLRSNQKSASAKKGNSRRRNISFGSTKESARGTRFCSTPSLLIWQTYNFSTLIMRIVQQDSRQAWVDNWNG